MENNLDLSLVTGNLYVVTGNLYAVTGKISAVEIVLGH